MESMHTDIQESIYNSSTTQMRQIFHISNSVYLTSTGNNAIKNNMKYYLSRKKDL